MDYKDSKIEDVFEILKNQEKPKQYEWDNIRVFFLGKEIKTNSIEIIDKNGISCKLNLKNK